MRKKYLDFSGLLNLGVGDFLRQENEMCACKNVFQYKIGKPQKVPGYSLVATVGSSSINFLHYYYKLDSNKHYLLGGTTDGSDYKLYQMDADAGTFSLVNTSTAYNGYASANLSAVNYLNKSFIVGYKDSNGTFLPNATMSGTTFSTSDTDLTSMPNGKFIITYNDLLYVLNVSIAGTRHRSRAYFCGEPTAGAIAWNLDVDFVEFGQNDGDEITGAAVAYNNLVVFKQNSCWKYDENNKDRIAGIGCDSYKTIVDMFGTPYWFNRNGLYRWTGGIPQLISNKVQPFINAIDQSKLNETLAVRYEFEYRCFIGDVTVDGISYQNTWLCFDIRRETWYVRCTYHKPASSTDFMVSGALRTYFGSTTGPIYKFASVVDNVFADGGQEIDSFFIVGNYDMGDPSVIKNNTHIAFITRNCQGLRFAVDADNSNEFNDENIQIQDTGVTHDNMMSNGNLFRFKFYEKSSNKSWELDGFVLSADNMEDLT